MTMDCCTYESCGNSRSFLTREEKVAMLKAYKKDLELEAQGVNERIIQLEQE